MHICTKALEMLSADSVPTARLQVNQRAFRFRAGKGMAEHDHSYKLLFSHPQMVRDLLEGFIPGDWLSQLDYDSLQKVSGSYVSDDLRARTDDIVWRVRWGKGWIYVYLLIEFQSAIEPYMAVRILTMSACSTRI